MNHRINCRVVALVAVLAGVSAFAPAARAAISPTLSLDQSAGTKAGATLNLGLDLKFIDTGTDSPHDLAINLPPGLLADASRAGGSCLKAANVSGAACGVGSGAVTATPDPIPGVFNLPLSVSVPVTFYLVPSPAAGDLAGLAVEGLGEQIGSTGEIKLRPSGDPRGSAYRSISYCPINSRSPCRWWGRLTPRRSRSRKSRAHSTGSGIRRRARRRLRRSG